MPRRRKGEPTRLQRLRGSMRAFDGLPSEFRLWCAYYPRTVSGLSLAAILAESQGDVPMAKRLLWQVLPTEASFREVDAAIGAEIGA